jgi:formyl-CoA transferase
MLALAAREKTGRGQLVDSNLLNAALFADMPGATGYLNSGYGKPKDTGQPARKKVGHPCYALYKARDGKWVHIIDAFRDRPAERQLKGLGYPDEVAENPRFADLGNLTQEAYDELRDLLEKGVARLTAQEVVDGFKSQDMMAVPVRWYDEAFEDPQVLHNEMLLEAEHPVAGKMKMLGFPVKLSETPAELRLPPPVLGEHNREVLGGILGMTDEQIAALKDDAVI